MKPIIDISAHQDPKKINYDRLASQISGAILRVAYGARPDAHLERHYSEFRLRNIPIGFYQYLTEYHGVQPQVNVLKQGLLGKEWQLGLWADVELEKGATPLRRPTVHEYIRLVEAQVEEIFGIYTSGYYWSLIMGGAYYTNKKLWVAGYVNNIYKYMPAGWSDYWMWQYTDKGWLEGYPSVLDMNRFRYSEEEYRQWVEVGFIEPPEPNPPLTKLYKPCDSWCYVSQPFGANPGWYPTSKGHNGVDYGFSYQTGHPIYAAADGTVEVSRDDTKGYGRHIRIRHSHGVTIYGHLSARHVQVGDKVKAKQVIGLSGGDPSDPYAGWSTGPHLHFEYRLDIPAPQVPGGYVYNAIDTLPITVDHEEWSEGDQGMRQVKVICGALNIRAGIGTKYRVIRTVLKGTILPAYEVQQGWVRVGNNEWCSAYSGYVQFIDPPVGDDEPEPTMTEKVDKLWEAHPELHD